MATHFARGILSTGEPLSTRLSAACHQSARLLPTYRQARFCASRSLLAELLFMLYGISELPEIINAAAAAARLWPPAHRRQSANRSGM